MSPQTSSEDAMKIRIVACAALVLGSFLLGTAQQSPSQTVVRKERMHDVPTPGLLAPLRHEIGDRLNIDAPDDGFPPSIAVGVDPETGAKYRLGELLVRFKSNAGEGARAQALQLTGRSRVTRVLAADWRLVSLESGTSLSDAAGALARSDVVDDVALNYILTTQQLRPNDENYGLQWNFDAINLPLAWQINPGGRNDVTVAVVDTGLNTLSETFVFSSPIVGQVPVRFSLVPDLVADGRIQNAYDFVYDDEFPVDLGGHGTHVAGTIAQQTNNNLGVAGVAYNVRLMPLKVISGGSLQSWDEVFFPANPGGTAAVIAEAIRYAADNNARVINLSLGGTGSVPTVRDAIQYAVSRGAFVSIAAGNDGDRGNPTTYPAAYAGEIAGAMTVGAVNRNLRRAPYSGFQPYVEICAPGGETTSEVDYQGGVTQVGYEEASTLSFLTAAQKIAALRLGFRPRFDRFELRPFQGTSMAAPHVSGVAALLYAQGVRSPAAIEEAIKRFAAPLQARVDECGAGLVDARRTLRGLGLAR
jgi:serine protease